MRWARRRTAATSRYSPSIFPSFLFLQLSQEEQPKRRRNHYYLDDSEDYSEGHRHARRRYVFHYAANSPTSTRWKHCWNGAISSRWRQSPSTICPNRRKSPSNSSLTQSSLPASLERTSLPWLKTCWLSLWTSSGTKRARPYRISRRFDCNLRGWWARVWCSCGHPRNTSRRCWQLWNRSTSSMCKTSKPLILISIRHGFTHRATVVPPVRRN